MVFCRLGIVGIMSPYSRENLSLTISVEVAPRWPDMTYNNNNMIYTLFKNNAPKEANKSLSTLRP